MVKRPKTPPFHGGNTSSNLVRVTKIITPTFVGVIILVAAGNTRFEKGGFATQNFNSPGDC